MTRMGRRFRTVGTGFRPMAGAAAPVGVEEPASTSAESNLLPVEENPVIVSVEGGGFRGRDGLTPIRAGAVSVNPVAFVDIHSSSIQSLRRVHLVHPYL